MFSAVHFFALMCDWLYTFCHRHTYTVPYQTLGCACGRVMGVQLYVAHGSSQFNWVHLLIKSIVRHDPSCSWVSRRSNSSYFDTLVPVQLTLLYLISPATLRNCVFNVWAWACEANLLTASAQSLRPYTVFLLFPKVPKSTYQSPVESELLAKQRETQRLRAEVQGCFGLLLQQQQHSLRV